jgi:hypothetical protein
VSVTYDAQAKAAILRGLQFIYASAADRGHFLAYGHDYLFALGQVSLTSRDPIIRELAQEMGQSCAMRWRDALPDAYSDADADDVANALLGNLAAERLGLFDRRFKSSLLERAGHFTAEDFFWFDPKIEGPPGDVPMDCTCGLENRRGIRRCHECGAPLRMMSRYEVFVVALIRSYVGDRHGISVGAAYSEVLKRATALRPYPHPDAGDDWQWSIYVATHLVYTLNDYNTFRLRAEWLPAEFTFLKGSLAQAIANDDPDAVGEILDSLKSFGLTGADALVAGGTEYLLSSQNADGSWGACDIQDLYERYHSTLAAINGLDDYIWAREAPRFAEVKRTMAAPDVVRW